MENSPPVLQVADLDGSLIEKIKLLSNVFEKKYSHPPMFIARVPGR